MAIVLGLIIAMIVAICFILAAVTRGSVKGLITLPVAFVRDFGGVFYYLFKLLVRGLRYLKGMALKGK